MAEPGTVTATAIATTTAAASGNAGAAAVAAAGVQLTYCSWSQERQWQLTLATLQSMTVRESLQPNLITCSATARAPDTCQLVACAHLLFGERVMLPPGSSSDAQPAEASIFAYVRNWRHLRFTVGLQVLQDKVNGMRPQGCLFGARGQLEGSAGLRLLL